MVELGIVEQACREEMRRIVIRYFALSCMLFGVFSILGGILGGGNIPLLVVPTVASGSLLALAGICFLLHPPVGGLRLIAMLFFAGAGINLAVWGIALAMQNQLATFWPVIPIFQAFFGAFALHLRTRFGDRIRESSSPQLRREVGKILAALYRVNPARSSNVVSFVSRDEDYGKAPTFTEWHGWLSPSGYAVFLLLNSPTASNENVVTGAMHIRNVHVADYSSVQMTPTGEQWKRGVGAHITVGGRIFPNARTTPESMANYQRWKQEM